MTHTMTLRISDELYERIRQEAFDRRISMTALVNESLDPHRRATRDALIRQVIDWFEYKTPFSELDDAREHFGITDTPTTTHQEPQ